MKNIAKILLLSLVLVKSAHSYGIVLQNNTDNQAEMTIDNLGSCKALVQKLEPKENTPPIHNSCRVSKVTAKVNVKQAMGTTLTKTAKPFSSIFGRKASEGEVDTYVLQQEKNGNFVILRQ